MGRGGALVEEARQMMQQNEEEEPAAQQNEGPKIKMSKIGRKPTKKASTGGPGAPEKKAHTGQHIQYQPEKSSSGPGGFTEQDIEFMKKAIQVLCQSTNPLGKSIDFVTDDIDSMNKEFEHWKKESSSCQSQLLEQ